jgi:cell wall integrity and stress response component
VHTITYTPTSPPDPQNSNQQIAAAKSGLSTGQAVGLAVGLVALAVIIGLLIFFFIRRRRRVQAEGENDPFSPVSPNSTSPVRTMSENSRYMLGTDGRRVVEGWQGDLETPVSGGSRRSRLMPVDPRLDPFAPVYQRGDSSKSRESVQTIQDNHDYSRRVHQQGPILRATNPDT